MLTFIGFGDYLHSLDPSRSWQEHLHHMLVFCQVHVKRNFAKKFPQHPMLFHVDALWNAETKQGLLEKMDSICVVHPELKPFFNGKKADWILAGLTIEQSKVPYEWWVYARKHTGISESSHFRDNNYTGRKLSLLSAILR